MQPSYADFIKTVFLFNRSFKRFIIKRNLFRQTVSMESPLDHVTAS